MFSEAYMLQNALFFIEFTEIAQDISQIESRNIKMILFCGVQDFTTDKGR